MYIMHYVIVLVNGFFFNCVFDLSACKVLPLQYVVVPYKLSITYAL